MTESPTVPSYRLKLPCADEREFREKFLQRYVSRGVFVPSERPKPIGTRLKLKLEIKGGTVLVSGDGMVTSVDPPGSGAKPGMTVRLTALHHDSIQFSLSPSENGAARAAPPKAAPSPAAAKATPKPGLPTPPAAQPPMAPHAAPAPAAEKEPLDLSDADFELAAQPDEDVMAVTDPAIPVPAELAALAPPRAAPMGDLAEPEPERSPEPSPEPARIPPPTVTAGAPRPGATRRRLAILMAAGAVVAVAATVTGVATSRSARASRQAAARVEEQLRLADLRLLEGRLAGSGGDSALDHLLEARGAAPDDRRVATRLALLADKFQQLGDAALARKNLAEASVHYKATLAADPARAAVAAKLADIAAKPQGAAPAP